MRTSKARMGRFLLAAGLLLSLGLRVPAATYVVSPDGKDTNPGTAVQPFQTINRAAQIAGAGDTVRVKAGLYREAVALRKSGTEKAPITFLAETPGSVVVTGADVITGWEKAPGAAPIYRVKWDHLFAINWENGKPIEYHADDPLWGRAEQVIVDGKQLLPIRGVEGLTKAWEAHLNAGNNGQPSAIVPSPLPHLGGPFVGCFAVDTANKSLYLWMGDGSNPNLHPVEAATRAQIFGVNPWEQKDGVQNIVVKGFIFRYGASFPQRGAVWLHGQHNRVENCVIEEMSGGGIQVNGTLKNSLVRNCGHVGGGGNGDNFTNENCLWEGNCWKPIDRDWDAGGFKMAVVKNGLFRHCLFRNNGGPGLWFDIDVHNVRVTECVFEDNEGSGLFIEISRSIQADHNLFIGNATGSTGDPKNGGWSSGGIQLGESEDCRITNNTCVGNKDGITFREQGPRPLDTDSGKIPFHDKGDVITQNVSALNSGYQIGLWYDNGFFGRHPADNAKYTTEEAFSAYLQTTPDKVYDPTRQNLMINSNLYFAGEKAQVALYGVPWRVRHQEYASLGAFTAKTGFDAHSQISNPLFVNAAIGNYRFQKNSPAHEMQAGWADAPADVETWIRSVLPRWALLRER